MTLPIEQTEADVINAENTKLSQKERREAVWEDLCDMPKDDLADLIMDKMSDTDIDEWLKAED